MGDCCGVSVLPNSDERDLQFIRFYGGDKRGVRKKSVRKIQYILYIQPKNVFKLKIYTNEI